MPRHHRKRSGSNCIPVKFEGPLNTIRAHMQSLLAKLGVHSVLEAIALAGPQLGKSWNFRTTRWASADA